MKPLNRNTRWVTLVLIFGLAVSHMIRPGTESENMGAKHLSSIIPSQFGDWIELKDEHAHISLDADTPNDPTKGDRPTYDETLTRTYINRRTNAHVMLALAYGRHQSQELRIHRPELCYRAQGFEVKDLGTTTLNILPQHSLRANILLSSKQGRIEPITYWIRIGNRITNTPWQTRGEVFNQGIRGIIPDGMLVRVSTISTAARPSDDYSTHRAFISDLLRSTPPETAYLLAAF